MAAALRWGHALHGCHGSPTSVLEAPRLRPLLWAPAHATLWDSHLHVIWQQNCSWASEGMGAGCANIAAPAGWAQSVLTEAGASSPRVQETCDSHLVPPEAQKRLESRIRPCNTTCPRQLYQATYQLPQHLIDLSRGQRAAACGLRCCQDGIQVPVSQHVANLAERCWLKEALQICKEGDKAH